jgi:hypothetical protein
VRRLGGGTSLLEVDQRGLDLEPDLLLDVLHADLLPAEREPVGGVVRLRGAVAQGDRHLDPATTASARGRLRPSFTSTRRRPLRQHHGHAV